jgi:hypothetical protein
MLHAAWRSCRFQSNPAYATWKSGIQHAVRKRPSRSRREPARSALWKFGTPSAPSPALLQLGNTEPQPCCHSRPSRGPNQPISQFQVASGPAPPMTCSLNTVICTLPLCLASRSRKPKTTRHQLNIFARFMTNRRWLAQSTHPLSGVLVIHCWSRSWLPTYCVHSR